MATAALAAPYVAQALSNPETVKAATGTVKVGAIIIGVIIAFVIILLIVWIVTKKKKKGGKSGGRGKST